MKKIFELIIIFFLTFILYLGIATKWTFVPPWSLDYLNPLAQSMLHGRIDIPDPSSTYDLILYKGKWFAPWGPLAAISLIPLQIIKGRYAPSIYLSLLSASINAVVVFLLLRRLKSEFFPSMKKWELYGFLLFFLFGTTHAYVGTIGSSWHVDQMVTSVLGTLGLFIIFKKHRSLVDYRLSAVVFSATLIGRPTYIMLLFLPGLLYLWDNKYRLQKIIELKKVMWNCLSFFGVPLLLFSFIFFSYNYVRFGDLFEYGYRYIHEAQYLENRRMTHGAFSISNLTYNIWYMVFEIPKLTRDGPTPFDFNLKGNSIFFLSPPLLAIFLASPFIRKKRGITLDPYSASLWVTTIATMLPSLIVYSTGWMQFGYRYSLDVTVLLLLLAIYGMKGKLNVLVAGGIVFSVWMYSMGIRALQ